MRTKFADAAQHANAFFVIRAISTLHYTVKNTYDVTVSSAYRAYTAEIYFYLFIAAFQKENQSKIFKRFQASFFFLHK